LNDPAVDAILDRVVFYELLGFNAEDAEHIYEDALQTARKLNPASKLSPHAPYSTSARLLRLLARPDKLLSVHAAESQEETHFLQNGSGPFRAFLESRGIVLKNWQPPAVSPVSYLKQLGLLNKNTLLVHGVQTSGKDIQIIKEQNTKISICARSNDWMGVGKVHLKEYLETGILLTIGTDSLASNLNLDMNKEIYYIYRNFNEVSAVELIKMATLNGAIALHKEALYGSLEAGKRAKFNVFTSDNGLIENPEEFIVSKAWSRLKCF